VHQSHTCRLVHPQRYADHSASSALRVPPFLACSWECLLEWHGDSLDARHSGLQVLFQPKALTSYEATAQLSAKHASEAAPLPILTLEFSGHGRHPHLTFDTGHVLLPAVPLNVRSTCTFRVINDGYDNLDLKFRLPADKENVPLQLEFPEGTMVGIAKKSIPVVVTFEASKSTSFTANVEFLDQDGALAVHSIRPPTHCCMLNAPERPLQRELSLPAACGQARYVGPFW
jgi:hypothetical protein